MDACLLHNSNPTHQRTIPYFCGLYTMKQFTIPNIYRSNLISQIKENRKAADKLKKDFGGWTCWIISSNMEAIKSIGLHPSKKMTLFNASLECKLLKYEMYSGSKKASKQDKQEN